MVSLKLVTIVAEALLEEKLLRMIKAQGARGYSMGEVRGEGSRGVHASDWEGRNIRIEALVQPEVADRIIEHLAADYFPHYAVVAYVLDAQVARGDKYV